MDNSDFCVYDPIIARKITDKTKSQPQVGVLASVIYDILNERSGGDPNKTVSLTPKKLGALTAFNETQVKGAMQALFQLGLIKNMTKNGAQITGPDALDKLLKS